MINLVLRCSGLPLAFRCAGSVRPGAVPINESNDPADLGTAAHEGLAQLVETGKVDYDAVPALAKKHKVDETELRVLLAQGAQLWEQVRESFPAAMTEVDLAHEAGSVELTGHADILGRSGAVALVGDWKTGRVDSDYAEQLKGYAALALLEDHTLQSATAGVLWVRDASFEHYTMTRADLPAWLDRLETELVQWDGTFRPGRHCEYCPRAHECPAANAMVRSAVAALSDKDVDDAALIREMPAEQLIQLHSRVSLVESQIDRFRKAVRHRVEEQGDIVGDEKRITLETEERRQLDPLAAFPVLEAQGFGDAEMAEVIDISVSKAEKVVATRAGKGKGAGAVRELQAALKGAGAIKTRPITKLVLRRA